MKHLKEEHLLCRNNNFSMKQIFKKITITKAKNYEAAFLILRNDILKALGYFTTQHSQFSQKFQITTVIYVQGSYVTVKLNCSNVIAEITESILYRH